MPARKNRKGAAAIVLQLFDEDIAELHQARRREDPAVPHAAVVLKGQGFDVKFMNPKEGIFTYCCGLVLAAGAPNPERAYDLLDAMIAPEAGKWLIETQGYGHSNRKAFDLVPEAILAERGLPRDPTQFLANGILFKPNKQLEEISSMFEAVKAGL